MKLLSPPYVVDEGELEQREEDESDANDRVDVDGLHVRHFRQAGADVLRQRYECQQRARSCFPNMCSPIINKMKKIIY